MARKRALEKPDAGSGFLKDEFCPLDMIGAVLRLDGPRALVEEVFQTVLRGESDGLFAGDVKHPPTFGNSTMPLAVVVQQD